MGPDQVDHLSGSRDRTRQDHWRTGARSGVRLTPGEPAVDVVCLRGDAILPPARGCGKARAGSLNLHPHDPTPRPKARSPTCPPTYSVCGRRGSGPSKERERLSSFVEPHGNGSMARVMSRKPSATIGFQKPANRFLKVPDANSFVKAPLQIPKRPPEDAARIRSANPCSRAGPTLILTL